MSRTMSSMCLLLLLLALGLPGEASAQGPSRADCAAAGLKDCTPLNDFITRLRAAVKDNDKTAVAGMVSYPMAVQFKKRLEIENKDAFVQHYDAIMTQAVREALAEQPFVNPRQIIQFVGDKAQVWLDVDQGQPRIGSIIGE